MALSLTRSINSDGPRLRADMHEWYRLFSCGHESWGPTVSGGTHGPPAGSVYCFTCTKTVTVTDRRTALKADRELVSDAQQKRKTAERGRINVIGSARRLQSLALAGWTSSDISRIAGMEESSVSAIRRARCATVEESTHRKILVTYEWISCHSGGSIAAITHARRKGWTPAAAWVGVDMDDPAALPKAPW